jgi:hypothetical protein
VNIVEEVEQAEGIDCDRVVSKMSEDELKELLEKVRNKRRKKKMQHVEEGEANAKLVRLQVTPDIDVLWTKMKLYNVYCMLYLQ